MPAWRDLVVEEGVVGVRLREMREGPPQEEEERRGTDGKNGADLQGAKSATLRPSGTERSLSPSRTQ